MVEQSAVECKFGGHTVFQTWQGTSLHAVLLPPLIPLLHGCPCSPRAPCHRKVTGGTGVDAQACSFYFLAVRRCETIRLLFCKWPLCKKYGNRPSAACASQPRMPSPHW
eukprot:10237375-Alexandrium_andersonii.AAC.1